MKNWTLSLLAAGLLSAPAAQAQELPDASPRQRVEQEIGLTTITVDYSRPGKKGREIFGGLVPYGELWRTGANKATTISFDSPVVLGGEEVEKGKYSLFTIPGEEMWTVILNSETDLWGTGNYNAEKDVLRLKAKVQEAAPTENLTIGFDHLRTEEGKMYIRWDRTQVMLTVDVPATRMAIRNIEKALAEAEAESKWRVYRNAANFYFDTGLEPEKALKYMQKSLELKEDSWYSHWLHAEIQASMENYGPALEAARQALKLGREEAEAHEGTFPYAERIESAILEWSEKA